MRANGEGTIYCETRERGGKTQTYWVSELSVKDDFGIYHRQRFRRRSQHDARAALERARREESEGRAIVGDRAKLTVSDVLDRWIRDAEDRVRPGTLRHYEQIARDHIKPTIGTMRAHRVRRRDIIRLNQELKHKGASDRVRELAHIIAQAAIGPHVAHVDPAEHPFPRRSKPRVAQRQMHVWSREETQAFLRAAVVDRYYALYYLALATGMRQGELLALRWRDVHRDRVVVTASLDQRTRLATNPKTETSRRRIAISAAVYEVLAAHKERMRAVDKALATAEKRSADHEKRAVRTHRGPSFEPSALVFTNEIGEPVHASNLLRRSFVPLLEAAGVPVIRFHDLRHTHATLLLSANVHPKIVQERLGHSSIRLTLDTYSHVLPSMQDDAAQVLGDIFAPPTAPPTAAKSGISKTQKSAKH